MDIWQLNETQPGPYSNRALHLRSRVWWDLVRAGATCRDETQDFSHCRSSALEEGVVSLEVRLGETLVTFCVGDRASSGPLATSCRYRAERVAERDRMFLSYWVEETTLLGAARESFDQKLGSYVDCVPNQCECSSLLTGNQQEHANGEGMPGSAQHNADLGGRVR